MTKGRKPQPSKLNGLRGNPGKRRVKADGLIYETAIPDPPEYLDGLALIEWNTITQILAANNVISTADRAILAAFCSTFAQLSVEEEALKKEPSILKTDKGYEYLNPRIGLVNTLRDKLAKYAAELGMTPSSRSRIHPTASPPAKDKKKRSLAENLFGTKVAS